MPQVNHRTTFENVPNLVALLSVDIGAALLALSSRKSTVARKRGITPLAWKSVAQPERLRSKKLERFS
jgi:hypothetical protein